MLSLDSQPRRARNNRRRWEHFPHDADIGVRGFAESPASAFEQGAVAALSDQIEPVSEKR
jgi:SHS2 domain-containing protein